MELVGFAQPLRLTAAAPARVPELSARSTSTRLSAATSYRMEAPTHGFQLDGGGSLQAEDALLEQIAGLSGARISRADALRVPAVLRARNIIAGVPSTLPIELRNRRRELDERTWLGEDPDPRLEQTVVYAFTFEDLLFESVSYWKVTRFSEGFPIEAQHVDLSSVSQHSTLGFPSSMVSRDLPFDPDDPVFIDGVFTPAREIIRFISPNPPLLKHAAKAIRTALLLDLMAEGYAKDPLPFGYFTDREDADPLEDDEINAILSTWESARQKRRWGYISQGLQLEQLEWPDPEKLQLAAARQHAVLEIARAAGLDPEDVGVSTTSRTYQNAEQRKADLIDFNLAIYISGVQDRLSKPDVTPRGLFARFDVDAFKRADTFTRMKAYEVGRRVGAYTDEEIRRAERKPELPPGQRVAPAGGGQPPGEDGGRRLAVVGGNRE
jgi:hypothetical protein